MSPEKIKLFFIVNPKAGVTPKSKPLIELIADNTIPSSKFETTVLFTEHAGHATLLAQNAIDNNADIIVAAGGDGTINEVAKVLEGTDIKMGILPSGSGNGLARCLGISMSYALALRTILKGNTRKIDIAYANQILFTSIAGVGFDAHVAQKFADSQLRGLISYMRIVISEFHTYKPKTYTLTIDGHTIERKALMIVFANSDRFGFSTRIAPEALPDDGYLDVCVVTKMPASELLTTIFHLIKGTPGKTGYAEYFKGKNISITSNEDTIMNIDGEPRQIDSPIEITVKPLSLNIIVP